MTALSPEQEMLSQLQKRVSQAPTEPGIYRWLDKDEKILYIGKAKNIRNRLKSYIQKPDKNLGPWKQSMLKQIADFSVTVTNSELEALILETNLIKENKPKYNVMMKDDKNYVYIEMTMQESYPQISVVRRMNNNSAKYFGPYTRAWEIRKILEVLHAVFPYRACKKSLDTLNRHPDQPFSPSDPACLEYQIGNCCGLCIGKLTKEEYRSSIEEIVRFLKGNHDEAIVKLTDVMKSLAANKKYEQATKIRDALQAIESTQEKQIVSDTTGLDMDVVGVGLLKGKAQVVVLKQRAGKLIDEQNFALAGEAEGIAEALSTFLPQYYDDAGDIPDVIIIGEEIEDHALLEKWLQQKREKKIELHVPERGKKSHLLSLAEKNANEKLKAAETKWEAAERNTKQALEELHEILDLENIPKRIEAYDISHLGGTETVGSMAVARNGKAASDQYRSFTIRSLKEGDIDDYKAIEEVLRRRLRYLAEDIKTAEARWKEKGVVLGKARKGEQKNIEVIIKEHSKELGCDDIDYKDFLAARRDKELIGFCRIKEHKGNVKELGSLWVHDSVRGEHLGHVLAQKMLKKIKEGKVYAIVDAKLENYYGELGFRHVHSAPKVLEEKRDTVCKEKCGIRDPVIVMYEAEQHKKDVSLSTQPDLLVIDGGKGQLSTALKVLKEYQLEIAVIGLAKREEEVFVPGQSVSIPFPKDSQAKFLLMRLRNEAHRFANRHREKRGKRAAVASALDEVPGIGEETKKKLLKVFGSVANIRNASDKELRTILTKTQLKTIRDYFTMNDAGTA